MADESDPANVWQILAESVSRMFDRECEVADGFFDQAPNDPVERAFRGVDTVYLPIGPYIPGSITAVTYDGAALVLASDPFVALSQYLQFPHKVPGTSEIVVTARFGFPAVPVEVTQACIEQALMMWRRKDMAFAEISGVSSAVLTAQFSPMFESVAKRYRGLYSGNQYFA